MGFQHFLARVIQAANLKLHKQQQLWQEISFQTRLIQEAVQENDIDLSILESQRGKIAEEYFQQIKSSEILTLKDRDARHMAEAAINAFFDNDLLYATQLFMRKAKGSFGLCVTCSADARRQLIVAARGQTMSVAFYPKTGMVLYGSEQAAMKAAVGVKLPGQKDTDFSEVEEPIVENVGRSFTNDDADLSSSMPKILPQQNPKFLHTRHYIEVESVAGPRHDAFSRFIWPG